MLTIAVLTYTQQHLLKDCIESIQSQELPQDSEILILNNGGPAIEEDRFFGVRILNLKDNFGNIGGENLCFENALYDWVLFVADDVRVGAYCIRSLWNKRSERTIQQPILLNGGCSIDNLGLKWIWPGYGVSENDIEKSNPFAITCSCYFMHKRIWEDLGGFDESLISSHEDIDFCMRARKKGYEIEVNRSAVAFHIGNQTLKHSLLDHSQVFHQARVKVIKKYYRGLDRWLRLLTINFLDAIIAVKRLVLGR